MASNTHMVFESPPNQRLSMYEQLELGARFVEVDLHYIQQQHRLVSCHISRLAAYFVRDFCQSLSWKLCNNNNIFDYGSFLLCFFSSKQC